MELDLARLLEVLERHEVAYVLIGGLAAVYHGSPFPTEDADITPRADRSNLARLAAALRISMRGYAPSLSRTDCRAVSTRIR